MLRLGGSVAADFGMCFAGPAEECLATLPKFFDSDGFPPLLRWISVLST